MPSCFSTPVRPRLLRRTRASTFWRVKGHSQAFHGRKCVELRCQAPHLCTRCDFGKDLFGGGVTSAVAPASRSKAASVACHNQTTKGPAIMTNRTALFSAAVVSLGVALAPAAFAADDM